MIKANLAPTVVVVEAGGVVFSNNHVKASKRIKASKVRDEKAIEEEENPHMDVETPKISNSTTASLDTMPWIVSTKMNKPILQKQQMRFVVILFYFLLMMIQIHKKRFGTSILVQAITCVGRKICL